MKTTVQSQQQPAGCLTPVLTCLAARKMYQAVWGSHNDTYVVCCKVMYDSCLYITQQVEIWRQIGYKIILLLHSEEWSSLQFSY